VARVRYATSRFDALGFAFWILADDPRLTRHIGKLFADLTTSAPDGHRYTIRTVGRLAGNPRCELTLDGHLLFEQPVPERLVPSLVQHVNRRAVEDCDLLTLHAGGVESGGMGLVFPGIMEAGKTTLVAGLVRSGFGYLTDEAVAIDRESLLIQPYPKPLSLDPGSWPLFPELEPQADLATDEYKASEWQVPIGAIRPGALGRSCPVGVVVFPRYEPGADAALEPLGRAEALVELAQNTFKFPDRSRDTLDLLAEVVRPAACYRLTTGELDRAVEAVSSLAGAAPGRRAS
jgi:hypothetical protein